MQDTNEYPIDELLTIDELADRLKVQKSWLYTQTRLKEIPFFKVGKYLRFNFSEVYDWIIRNQT